MSNYHAALIFQHGETSEDFKIAHQLAEKSMKMGYEEAKWLYAATEDRWLRSLGKAQKWGTQFTKDLTDKDTPWELAQPIDETVTDDERAKYNVPPINQALDRFKKRRSL